MRKIGLKGLTFTRKSHKYNSYKGTVGRVAMNRIHRRFVFSVPRQEITTDTSEFKYCKQDTNEKPVIKRLYLEPLLDMLNGKILACLISEKPTV